MNINGRVLSQENVPYVIAEISGNHLGEKWRAFRLIESAKKSGADAVKFQYYTADSITIDHDGPGFVLQSGPWQGRKLHDLYQEAHTPPDWFPELFSCARELHIQAFSSVFDPADVYALQRLDPPAYKISSFDIQDHSLIERMKQTGKPIILSTGMASDLDVKAADDALGADYPHLFLHCVSGYPTPIEDAALCRIRGLQGLLAMDVGLSDHTLGIDVPIAAVAVGTVLIEKHLTLSRGDGGPDAAFSLEPHEFADLVKGVRRIHHALHRDTASKVEDSSKILRKSLYFVRDMSAGDTVTEQDVRAIRPGLGLHPRFLSLVLGRPVRRDVAYGSPVAWADLSE